MHTSAIRGGWLSKLRAGGWGLWVALVVLVEGWGVSGGEEVRRLGLVECERVALERSRKREVSRFGVALAEAQHRQALAGYWPQVSGRGGYQRSDEAFNFMFPTSVLGVPPQQVVVPAGTSVVTVPAGVLGPGAVSIPVATPEQVLVTPGQMFQVPSYDVKLMDPDSFVAAVEAKWLLYDGGMRDGYRKQGRAGVKASMEAARRTDHEILDSVRRYYWGAVLAVRLHGLGRETLERLEATLGITETMYKEGAGRVKKTDYLDAKVVVETFRGAVAMLEKNELMAGAALANSMGLGWSERVVPEAVEIVYEPAATDLEGLVGMAYEFSPDWKRLEAALAAAEGGEKVARSGHAPRLAVTGELHRWWNGYDQGLSTEQNREGWTVGVGLEIPLFDGFLTRGRVAEARARVGALREQKLIFKEGLALQIKDLVLGLTAVRRSHQASLEARLAAEENRDLSMRAYQNELMETEKVIRAQLVEAFATAQHWLTRYAHVELQSRLSLVVGSEVWRQLEGGR